METERDVVIVGAGHAGAQAAAMLRQSGFTGSIAMLTDEPELPYERPPLSKEYLSAQKPFERLLIRPAGFWGTQSIEVLLEHRVTQVDAGARRVLVEGGKAFRYQHLIWATGGVPRKLPCAGSDLAGVHTIRNRIDVDRIAAELPDVEHVVVVGGGYIGLEAAAVMTKFGKRVTVLETLNRVLARVAGEVLSRFYEGEHRAHGVDLRLETALESIEGSGGRVSGVRLKGGEVIPCQMVIVGIGIVPAVAPLLAAGAQGGNGVDVDAHCRTSLPGVYAIGDCASHVNRYAQGARIRLESVQNANDQAATVAHAILGKPQAYDAVPWFWSNQYDLKLQSVGIATGHDQVVVRGDPSRRSFSVVYLRGGKVVALDCVNVTKDYVQGRLLVLNGAEIAPAALQDATRPLKELAAAGA